MKLWFTSDTHYNHQKMVERRGHVDKDDMNEDLRFKWNQRIAPEDMVFHLGDVCFSQRGSFLEPFMKSLNGFKVLVPGNHDKHNGKMLPYGFDLVSSRAFVTIRGHHFKLAHPPYQEGQIERHLVEYGEFFAPESRFNLLCGHVHDGWKKKGRMLNVGVDVWDGWPVSEEEILKEFGLE